MRELIDLLAESTLRQQSIDRIHRSHTVQIGSKLALIDRELGRLRSQIGRVGVGANRAIENRYMQLLQAKRTLEQSRQIAERSTPSETIPADLQKMLDYGALLLNVYGSGSLIKSSSIDLARTGEKLVGLPYAVAKDIGKQLLELANDYDR